MIKKQKQKKNKVSKRSKKPATFPALGLSRRNFATLIILNKTKTKNYKQTNKTRRAKNNEKCGLEG